MKFHSIVRFLVGLGTVALTAACGEPRAARDVDAVGASECRSYATAASVRVGGVGGDISCDFDAGARRHECRVAAGGATVLTSADYESVADFVEAARYIGKVTSLSETRSENGVVQRLTHHYDELAAAVSDIDPHEPFPRSALRVSRGKHSGTQVVSLPEGFLQQLDDDSVPEDADEEMGGDGG